MTSKETDSAAPEIRKLKKKLKKARRKLKRIKARTGSLPGISPLAPKGAFPALPAIGGADFAATQAGIKYRGRDDVMLVRLCAGSTLAGLFTRSETRAAPVLDCERKLAALAAERDRKDGFAIVVNSGNANAFCGSAGVRAVEVITGAVADKLGISADHVLSASTGVIGEPLEAGKIVRVLDKLAEDLSPRGAARAALAILTTDTFAKGATGSVEIGGKTVRIAGFAKGSGMIAPDMATMLVFIFTDAALAQSDLQEMLAGLNETSFNSITVDGDTSTSDSLIMAATGASGVSVGSARSDSGKAFSRGLGQVMTDLAQQVVRDGEGATKFLEIAVVGATDHRDAKKVAMAIANSPLVKTAVAGEDPNWGRVVMAVGKSGARADRDRLSIRFGEILVANNGAVSPDYTEEQGARYMKRESLVIGVDLGLGTGKATVWTCDLTKQYITINADYRS